ncbi:hypothetical protein D9619_003316 [Psilocybe cf. subviscida]|uniref:C3H1-type domain-containing protein n=1 Tax=Psilocybe cf. subviscida TaxID=2480587 RepID=A0A8H5AXC8_9AGAR|nr:hypothetical protein D9619_003316 [Psilocybe cf. subviscida]
MVFDPESAVHLKPWLVRTLEPICDAEPGALADYILALLKHNVPEHEMRQELAVQLDEFLEKGQFDDVGYGTCTDVEKLLQAECAAFIETLFTVIRTKSYLPYNAAGASSSSLDNGIPIPLDALLTPSSPSPDRTRKRSTTDDDRDGRPPAKNPRLGDGPYNRYGGGDGRVGPQATGAWTRPQFRDGGMGMGMNNFNHQMGMAGMNGMGAMNGRRPQGYQPPDQIKRGICRDYHNNGYCARGAMCKYSHGDDAVVPGQLYPGNGMPFMPMFSGAANGMPFMQGAAYDPNEARMDMRPMGGRPNSRAPLLPRMQEDGGRAVVNASGELPVIQDLTPVVPPDIPPADGTTQADVDMKMATSQIPFPNAQSMGGGYNPMSGMNGNMYPAPMDMDNSHVAGMRPPSLGRGGFRGRGGGRGRGTFGGEVHNFRPEKRGDKTLVVEKIPEDKLSLESVNEWFKRFGTVTNVAVDAHNAKALVSFSSHDEAHAAWKSEDAVFNNRFVKVFWHRPMEGHGSIGARMLAASAPLVANMSGNNPPSQSQPTEASSATTPAAPAPAPAATTTRKPAAPSAAVSALALKQQLLEQKITEQKTLMASLDTASPLEKKTIMARLRKLGDEMTNLTSTPTPAPSSNGQGAAAKKAPITEGLTEQERKERERLDKELEQHVGTDGNTEEKEDLQAKLERLKAEAASLGLESALPSSAPPFRGGYRGRARAAPRGYPPRGGFMRGGPPRPSMKLDNRPKKLLVKGASEDKQQALKDWYETTGQLESIEPGENDSFVVSFKTRSGAEIGLAQGTNIPIVGSVQVSWHNPSATSAPKSAPAVQTTNGHHTPSVPAETEGHRSPEPSHSHPEEEEIASGWGGGDDEDSMGLL